MSGTMMAVVYHGKGDLRFEERPIPVSYTHLTLPTT